MYQKGSGYISVVKLQVICFIIAVAYLHFLIFYDV